LVAVPSTHDNWTDDLPIRLPWLTSGQSAPAGAEMAAHRDRRAVAIGRDALGMDGQPRLVSVNARLGSEELGLQVEIRIRELDGRWLAVADFGGEPEVGIGATPRTALAAALASLGERAASALMADPQLFGLSVAIARPA
jgi:hypothetical protein